MWLCPRCGTANPKYIEKMETRKLSGKHHRTDILHIFQRIGIIVIVVATKYNPNCTPSNIKKIWTWQSQTDEFSTIFGCSDEGPTQPGPLQRSFESYCGRWSDSMSFDEVWKEVGLSENGLSMNIPNLIPHWQFCWLHFQTRVCSKLQTLSRVQSFQTISASGPREILHADFIWFCATKDASFVKIRPFRECVLFSMEDMTG